MTENQPTPDNDPETVEDAAAAPPAKPRGSTRGKAKPKPRIETFTAVRPDRKVAHIERNIDTGEQSVVKVEDA
ncbi:MAG: hypothetical protein QM809_11465 [Gordonia sp. (in: high G+C Gram-positive bacteria)]|uniref:hypothetical protein n=1 Tax=Gordonia sp. (in: high G+C Gram-positive bacteria) TaxID=84139 RepID=UPI0039E4C6B0